MRRQQIRVGGRWARKGSGRCVTVTWIVYPHFVEYKYERPPSYKARFRASMKREPFTRKTRVSYRKFILDFKRPQT